MYAGPVCDRIQPPPIHSLAMTNSVTASSSCSTIEFLVLPSQGRLHRSTHPAQVNAPVYAYIYAGTLPWTMVCHLPSNSLFDYHNDHYNRSSIENTLSQAARTSSESEDLISQYASSIARLSMPINMPRLSTRRTVST
jgi:hypothetical protein